MTENEIRNQVADQATALIGKKESDGSHKEIIDRYNEHKPLARGYKVKYTDSWCAVFASVIAILLKLTDIIPTECSCQKMIDLFKKLNAWQESDAYTPKKGDYIFYDWNDSGKGDNTGWSDHVGVVTNVSGNTITVVEGNKNNAVGTRTIQVNARYIRGYGIPNYASKATKEESVPTSTPTVKLESARYKEDGHSKGTKFKTTTALNMRAGAGVNKTRITVLKQNTEVVWYGYYSKVGATKWYFVKAGGYTGFVSSKYLKRV